MYILDLHINIHIVDVYMEMENPWLFSLNIAPIIIRLGGNSLIE